MIAVHQTHLQRLVRNPSAIALGIGIACAGPAFAQTSANQATNSGTPEEQVLTEIVVTGSRINSPGFEAPTPLTVLNEAELRQAGRTDLSATLNDLPQFRATQTATSTNTVTTSGQSPADLRGLGSSRTLVLINNRRFVSSDDLQTIPYSLVKRVDVVTGGASAAYGSDAVAGVVNILLDDEKEGLELGAQGGRSTHGDAGKQLFEASYGTALFDHRGHFMIGADYLKDEGVIPALRRPLLGGAGFFPGADGKLYPTADLHSSDHSTGGLITTGILRGQTFNPDGALRPFQYGALDPVHAPYAMIGGEGYQDDAYSSLSAPIERTNMFARFSYDVTDSFKVWVEGGYNRVGNNRVLFSDLVWSALPLTIQSDNPFLDPTIRAQLAAAGENTFDMGRALSDVSLNRLDYTREMKQGTVGFDGAFGESHWRYGGYYGWGKQHQNMVLTDLTLWDEFNNAVDAVTGPNGTPVCRVALTDPSTACRPLNLFGSGRADPAAVAYSTANWLSIQDNWLETAGLTISGEPLELWNRPVSVATGIEYRKQEMATSHDENSLANKFSLINGINMPRTGNNVTEGFVEVAVPLLTDLTFAKKLDFNGAARVSDYSTSGGIWSWKLGMTWDIVDEFKLRTTRSRDIRAPNLVELFSNPETLFTSVTDISMPNQPSTSIILFTGGNAQLNPEIADTLTIGGVYSPSFFPGLQVSLDYYDIQIEDVIVRPDQQLIVNSCYDHGNQTACAQIERNPATGAINSINATYVNLAQFVTKGFDFEASYRTRFERLPGELTVRVLANYVDTMVADNGEVAIEGKGYLGTGANFLVPEWRGSIAFMYESERFGGDLRARYVGSGGYAPEEVMSIASSANHIAARTYVDVGLRTYIPMGTAQLTTYVSVQNLFDRQPALASYGSPYLDLIGRYFTLGVRANF